MVREYKILVLDNGDIVCIVHGQARMLTAAKIGIVKQFLDLIDPPTVVASTITEEKVSSLFTKPASKPTLNRSAIATHSNVTITPSARSVELAKKVDINEPAPAGPHYAMSDYLITLLNDLSVLTVPIAVDEASKRFNMPKNTIGAKLSMLKVNGYVTAISAPSSEKGPGRLRLKYMVNPAGHAFLVDWAK